MSGTVENACRAINFHVSLIIGYCPAAGVLQLPSSSPPPSLTRRLGCNTLERWQSGRPSSLARRWSVFMEWNVIMPPRCPSFCAVSFPYCPVRSCGIFWAAKPRPATVISLTKRTFPAIPGPVRIQMDGWEISEPAAQCATRAQYSAQSIYCYLVK